MRTTGNRVSAMLSANVGSLPLGRSVLAVGHAGASLCTADGPGGFWFNVLHAPYGRAAGAICDALPPPDGGVDAVAVQFFRRPIL
jgi:hypothetical protein